MFVAHSNNFYGRLICKYLKMVKHKMRWSNMRTYPSKSGTNLV